MSSADDAELSAILAEYEDSVRKLTTTMRNTRLALDRNRQQRNSSPRPSPPPSSDRELEGVRRGFRGRPDLLDFSCTLRPKPKPPVHHVRPLTPAGQERQTAEASSAGPKSEPMHYPILTIL